MKSITPVSQDQFESLESAILSGQVAHEAVPKLLENNPEFARWYRARAAARGR